MSSQPIRVLKFGSSVLASKRDLAACVHEVYRELRQGRRVVAVVSAIGDTTDRLLDGAERLAREPDPEALAALLSTGESECVALFTLALERAGIPATALDPARIDLLAEGDPLDSDPIALDVPALLAVLDERPVAVVPGFFGRDKRGRIALFGRGGSDLSALFIAAQLPNATARLVKDVDGVWERDPRGGLDATHAARASGDSNLRYAELSLVDALKVGGRIVQPKALRFALERALTFEVGALGSDSGTRVGPHPSRFAWPAEAPRALRVVLLGLGTVGLGVYRELARDPARFEVKHVLVRRKRGRTQSRVPHELLTSEVSQALLDECDVLVELLGGDQPAHALIEAALARGIDVVSANKAVVSKYGRALDEIAARSGARFVFSAAVGGALPVLETIAALRDDSTADSITSIEGVFNSTTNFVLDRLADGSSFENAVALAHERGFCEADPWVDLCGDDAAHKLELVARAAFGADVQLEWIERRGIDALVPAEVRAHRVAHRTVRLVGSCRRIVDGESVRVEARLAPRIVERGDPLAGVRAEQNLVRIDLASGERVILRGKGAGRWPTTESVLGDLLELARERAPQALATAKVGAP